MCLNHTRRILFCMLYCLSGLVLFVRDDFFVLETTGIGLRIFTTKSFLGRVQEGQNIRIFCNWQIEQGSVYGFETPEELSLFEVLITVSGVGPKMGLKLLHALPTTELVSCILADRRDELAQRAGVSEKTAAKIILELKEKLRKGSFTHISATHADGSDQRMFELRELLGMLGYPRRDIEMVCAHIDLRSGTIEEHLKKALKELSKHKIQGLM